MKKNIPFLIECCMGITLAGIGLFSPGSGYYASLLFAVGCGLFSVACVQLLKAFYYHLPKNSEKLAARKQAAYIDRVDERKVLLRMKSAALTSQLMVLLLLLLSFVLALFQVAPWVIALPFGLFLLQMVLGAVIYRHLERKI